MDKYRKIQVVKYNYYLVKYNSCYFIILDLSAFFAPFKVMCRRKVKPLENLCTRFPDILLQALIRELFPFIPV